MKKKIKKLKGGVKKKGLKIFRLNFHVRQGGMLESYKPLTLSLVRYYIAQISHTYTRTAVRVKIYIEDPMGFTKEQILPLLVGMPPNVKFIWGKRKKVVK